MQETTMPQSETESMSELWYQKEEADLTKKIIAALKDSTEVTSAAKAWAKAKEAQTRIKRELTEMENRRGEIAAEIEDLKRNFGAEDSFADLKKIEGFQAELKALNEVMPVMEQRLRFDSPASRELEALEGEAHHWIALTLNEISPALKENIDRKVMDLRRAMATYHTVAERVRAEQKVVPAALLRWETIRKIVPEIIELDDLVSGSPAFFAGAMRRGMAIGQAQAVSVSSPPPQAPINPKLKYISRRS
jgi:hypothetical protein